MSSWERDEFDQETLLINWKSSAGEKILDDRRAGIEGRTEILKENERLRD